MTARAGPQHINGSVLGEFDRAVLSYLRTTGSRLRKLNVDAHHRDEKVVTGPVNLRGWY